MTGDGPPESPAQRAARLDRVFGDPLPSTTGDERSPEDRPDAPGHERWLHDNRPPHHDPAP